MPIIDNEGRKIMVTELDKAIEQAEAFATFRYEEQLFESLNKS